jgi:tRNA dimethylallyltransferase
MEKPPVTKNNKLTTLVLVGPTASGKSELAVALAKKFNGEIISCDSRQIYKGMDLGTGKVEGNWRPIPIAFHPERVGPREGSLKNRKIFVYKSIPHHLIDFINPKKQYSAALFKQQAQKAIADVTARGKLPILCGGTAHWIDAVIYNQPLPDVKPNPKLRAKLEKQSVDVLFKRLTKLDPRRAANIDSKNKHRLIRALEIVLTTGKPVANETWNVKHEAYKTLWLGINQPQPILFEKIKKRLKQRLDQGMVKEVTRLHNQGLSWKKLESFGLEYKFVSLYLQKKLSYDEMFEQLFTAIKQYTKRQMTWWKRNKEIHWINNFIISKKLVEKFLR